MPLNQVVTRFLKPHYFRLGDLPPELLTHIFSYLSSWDYLSLVHTSQGYRDFIHKNAKQICLAALRSQPEKSTYTRSFTIDNNRLRYAIRWKCWNLRMAFRQFARFLVSHPRSLRGPRTKPMFLLYLKRMGVSLRPDVSAAYTRHILGELIEISWIRLGGLKHRSNPDLETVTIDLENTEWAIAWRRKWGTRRCQ